MTEKTNENLKCPSFIDMGLIIHSFRDLDFAYKSLKDGGFNRFILLNAGEDEGAIQGQPVHLMEKYPGLIPTFHPMENGKFKNLELLHTGGLGEQLIFYQHSLNASLYIASAYQIMLKAKDYNALFISFPHNKKLASGGVLHQGELSFKHGLPGLSYLSEEVVIARDIELARASEAKLHFHQISSKRSVELMRMAKNDGINVTCGTSAGHLLYTDNVIDGFNNNFKLNPPLRTEEDKEALIEGAKDGTIDCISIGHFSRPNELMPFVNAEFSSMKPEHIFSNLNIGLVKENILPMNKVIDLLAINPRKILGLPLP